MVVSSCCVLVNNAYEGCPVAPSLVNAFTLCQSLVHCRCPKEVYRTPSCCCLIRNVPALRKSVSYLPTPTMVFCPLAPLKSVSCLGWFLAIYPRVVFPACQLILDMLLSRQHRKLFHYAVGYNHSDHTFSNKI